jgi:hypothetical protein
MPTGIGSTLNRKDGWSQSGPLRVNAPNDSVSLQANFPIADVYTIQFGVSSPPSNIYRAVATITWTVEGNPITRQVDVGNGVSISAPSQAVKVIVNDATNTTTGGVPNEKYGVTISITRGTRPYTGQPATLKAINPAGTIAIFLLTGIGGGASVAAYAIPQNIGVISVEVTAVGGDPTSAPPLPGAPTLPNVTITHANGPNNLKRYLYTDQVSGVGFVSLSPQTTTIFLSNGSPTNNVFVSVTYGIDG